MTAQSDLKGALRDQLAPIAREHGFGGSAPTWRKVSDVEDYAIINIQSSTSSSAEHVRCVINISIAPEPWLRWRQQLLGQAMPRSVSESLGLFRERVHPTGSPTGVDVWWNVYDASSARSVVADMISQLDRGEWERLDRMLSREGILDEIRAGHLGSIKKASLPTVFARAEALLLMDAGPSDALDACLAEASKGLTEEQRPTAEKFARWVHEQSNLLPK